MSYAIQLLEKELLFIEGQISANRIGNKAIVSLKDALQIKQELQQALLKLR